MNWKADIQRLWNLVGHLKLRLFLAFIATLTSAGAAMIYYEQVRRITDAMLEGQTEIFRLGLLTLAIVIPARFLLLFLGRFLAGSFGEDASAHIRARYIDKINKLPVEFIHRQHSGDMLSRITNDITNIRDYLSHYILILIEVPFLMVLGLAYMLWINWSLTLLSVLLIPLMGWISNRISSTIGQYSAQLQRELGSVNEAAKDSLSGSMVTKSFNLEQRQLENFSSRVDKTVSSSLSLSKKRSLLRGLAIIFNICPFILCLLYGGVLISRGTITPGDLLAFVNLLNLIANPMQQIPWIMGQTQATLASVRRITDIIDIQSERETGSVTSPQGQPIVEFQDVEFSYQDSQVFSSLNFTLRPGERVALVGPSGGGKSTILKLISGFYTPNKGLITVMGAPIQDWRLNSLRDHLALVTQDTYLYPGTVAENIGYGKPGSTIDEIIQAAKIANAHDFILGLPQGYDSPVGELGNKLSGGQKQRISIARAILKDAQLLLLDEPTSALDTESEQLVQAALDTFMQGKAVIVVAHRLSTIKDAHRIIVVGEGKVLEEGTHDQLYARKGVYYNLYQTQFAHGSGSAQSQVV